MSSFDPSVPNVARVYDYLLGGKDNFEVDRMMAANLVQILPPLPQMLWENRRFVARAVTWVVIPPGFTDAQLWRAGWQDAAEPAQAPGRAFVGVGRVW